VNTKLPTAHDAAYVNAETVRLTLAAALDHWERASCDCCAPAVIDEAFDRIGYDVAYWERLRHFGIELAKTADNAIDAERGDKLQAAEAAQRETDHHFALYKRIRRQP
jgi:hypothetical protein